MIHPVFIGCDVSKAHLDFFDDETQAHMRIANTPCAIATWLDALDGREATVVLEATGRYDRRLCALLEERRRPYCRVNPARARDFARALGRLAKTDAIDARLLARLGRTLQPVPTPPVDRGRRALSGLHGRRDQLVGMRQQEKTRLHEADPAERDSLERHIAWLSEEITRIEQACQEALDADAQLHEQSMRLRSIPGIGPVTALTLLTQMPELGNRSEKAVAALAGLAPFNADSGTQRGQRHIRGGRKRVRDALYMAALVACRMKSRFATKAMMFRDKAKPFKVVIIAIARKILITANAIIRDKSSYNPT